MAVDLVIKNGLVIDPVDRTEKQCSVVIDNKKFLELAAPGQEPPAKETIDASGCIVTPGLIDSHLHIFYGGTENGVIPDVTLLPMGVTAAIDQGSAGSATFETFYNSVLSRTHMHLFATLNISTQGLITSRYPEELNPKYTNDKKIEELFAEYGEILKGIKLRISKEVVGELGMAPLEKALEVSAKVHSRIVVHTTNPPVPIPELLRYFRKEDIYTHVFANRGYSILQESGELYQDIYEARKRGVIFDAADARVHYTFPVIKEALKEGFLPDTISTDLVHSSCYQPGVFGLPRMLSKYLTLGLPLVEAIRAVTYRAAQVIHEEDRIGSFKPGICADVAIFKKKPCITEMHDYQGNTLSMTHLLVPQCTILKGEVVFRQFDF